jgi:hypothetical protein
VAGKPPEWAAELADAWSRSLTPREQDESELEHPLMRVLKEAVLEQKSVTHAGQPGTLYVTTSGEVLTELQKLGLRELKLPTNPSGMGYRLRSSKLKSITMLDEDSAPQYEELKRTANTRSIGFFVSDDAG